MEQIKKPDWEKMLPDFGSASRPSLVISSLFANRGKPTQKPNMVLHIGTAAGKSCPRRKTPLESRKKKRNTKNNGGGEGSDFQSEEINIKQA